MVLLIKKIIRKAKLGLWFASLALLWILFADLLRVFPVGHGHGVLFICRLSLLLLVLQVPLMWDFNRHSVGGVVVCVAIILLCFLFNMFNVAVSYEEWQSRGMPNWGTLSNGNVLVPDE